MVNNLPFTEYEICENKFIRKFSKDTSSEELLWHWDEEDRIIKAMHDTDWRFQFDNKLPQTIEGKIFIPKRVWHRLLRGNGELNLEIEKIYN